MSLSNKEKTTKAHKTIKGFLDQFGDKDNVKEAWIEIFLEAVYGNNIHLPSKEKQRDDKSSNDDKGGEMPTYKIE